MVEPFLSVVCDPENENLDIEVSYVDDIAGMHDPDAGRYEIDRLAHRKQIGPGPRDYESMEDTVIRKCILKSKEYVVVIRGHHWAGSPMAECGIGNTATVEITGPVTQCCPQRS